MLDAIYGELHRLASTYLRREYRKDHTLQPTALVNEAYLQLAGDTAASKWDSLPHFLSAAGRTMRRILIDHARGLRAAKRAGSQKRVPLDDRLSAAENAGDLVALDDALNRLAQLNARQAQVVELRFFAGLTVEETAEAAGISEKTVKRDWALARAWLESELRR